MAGPGGYFRASSGAAHAERDGGPMSLRNILVVYRKELTDSLRDRRTLISMVVVPLLIFPIMSIGIGTFVGKMVLKAQAEVPTIMIINGENSPQIVADLKSDKDIQVVPTEPDYKQQIIDKKIRAAVDVPSDFDASLDHENKVGISIYDYDGDLKSGIAAEKIEKRFDALQIATVKR